MTRRRWLLATLAVVALVATGAFVGVVLVGPEDDEDAAVGAAVNAVASDDPPAGMWAECEHERGLSSLRLRARYECTVRSCDTVSARLEVTDDLLDGWRFELKGRQPAGTDLRSGAIEPLPSTTITRDDVDLSVCPPDQRP